MIAGAGLATPSSRASATTPTIVRHGFFGDSRIRLPRAIAGWFQVLAREVLADHDDGRVLGDVGPGDWPARDQPVPHRREVVLADPFEAPDRRDAIGRARPVLDEDRIVAVESVHRDRGREADGRDAGDLFDAACDLLVRPRGLIRILDQRLRNRDAQRQHLLRPGEPGIDAPHCHERANHQARGDEQHHRETNLHDHERIPCPMTLASRAGETAAFLERAGHLRSGELEDGDEAEEHSSQERHGQREQQHHRVNRDLFETGQSFGGDGYQHADSGRREREADGAADQRERQALREQFPGDAPPAGAECRVDGELLLPAFGAHQKQVRDVGARDQQDDADRAEQNPEYLADIADDVGGERAYVGCPS